MARGNILRSSRAVGGGIPSVKLYQAERGIGVSASFLLQGLRKWAGAICIGLAVSIVGLTSNTFAQSTGVSSGARLGEGSIRSIRVEGTQRIEPETVLSYLTIKPGDRHDAEQVDYSLKRLFATGFFADVGIFREGDDVIIRVKENPIVNRVAFEGNKALDDDKIGDEVKIHPRSIFTNSRVQGDVTRIIELYRRSGRFAAKVTPKIVKLPQNRVDLIFEVIEGPQTGVGRINFVGNRAFTDRQLKGVIVTRESSIWSMFNPNDNYDPDRVAYDRELLRQHYTKKGYAEFSVVSAVAELTPAGDAFIITYTVEEGPQFEFGDVQVSTELKELNPEFLKTAIGIKTGEIYNSDRIEKAVDTITYLAGTFGYAFVDVRPRQAPNMETQQVAVNFRVNEGPRVYVERIDIVGNTTTLDRVIRREIRVSEGDAFNRILIDRSRSRIRGLGFFKEVEITEEPGTTPDRTILNVEVEEQPTGELSVGFGFSSEAYVGDISVTQRNLLGRGQFLRFRISASNQSQQVDLRFTEPYFMGRKLTAGFDIFKVLTDFEDESGFKSDSQGFALRGGFPLNEFSSLQLRYRLEQVDVDIDAFRCTPNALGFTLVSQAVCDQQGQTTSSAVSYTWLQDKRNDPIEPTSGTVYNINQEFTGLGGDERYLRTELDVSRYWPFFFDDFVLSARWQAGYLWSYDDRTIRLNDRFFKGGSSFRGFEPAGIGPRDLLTDDALGGKAYGIGTAELRIPTGLPEEFGIDAAIFGQVGTLGLLDDQDLGNATRFFNGAPRIVDDLSWRSSVGISFFWKSPFGPVRVDLAEVLSQEDYDKTEAFRFSAGTRF